MFVSRKHKLRGLITPHIRPLPCLGILEPHELAGRKFRLKLEHFRPSLAGICKWQLGLGFSATFRNCSSQSWLSPAWPGISQEISQPEDFPTPFWDAARQRKRAPNCEFTFRVLNREIQNWLYFIKLSFLDSVGRLGVNNYWIVASLFPIIIVFTPHSLAGWLGNRKTALFVFLIGTSKQFSASLQCI